MADNKSSLVQIAQDVLDETTQSIRNVLTVDGTVVDVTNPLPVLIDPQNSTQDILGVGIVGSRNNQVEISFDSAPGATLITETFSGGGSVTIANGHSIYSTGTATTASSKVVTVNNVVYRPAHEIYSYFTAAFTTGVANSFQRIGIFSDTDGFYIGYENAVFGISKRTASVNTFTARTSWNVDLLDGNAASKFTRNGTPEAINLVYSNLFRIRFAWLGSGSVIFDVFSPDGNWVTFHTIKIPNSQYNPSIVTPNLPLSLHVSKSSADATNLSIATACWAGGTTSDYVKISDTLNSNTLASLTRSVITGQTTAGGGGFVNVKVNPSGALTVEASGTVAATQSGTWNINNVSGTVSLPTGASTSANQNTIITSLQLIDDVITSDNTAIGTTKLAMVGGFDGTNAQYLSVTSAGAVNIADGGNSITVDGTVAATQSGTWNITNVSGTVSLPTGASTSANQSTIISSLQLLDDVVTTDGTAIGTTKLAMVGGFDGIAAQYLSTNSSGHVNIADGGNSITVDGTVNAVQSGNWTIRPNLLQSDGTTYAPMKATDSGSTAVGNAMKKFRDGFVTAAPDTNIWNENWTNQGTATVSAGGDTAGSSYLKISMCPFTLGSEYELWSKETFKLPNRLIVGVSASQRILGQELEISLVESSGGAIVVTPTTSTLSLFGLSISVTSNVATITFSTNHGLKGGDRVVLKANTDSRLNVGPVVVTVVTSTQITIPLTLANGTYTADGILEIAHPVKYAKNAVGVLFENTTATNGSFVARRNGAAFRTINTTIASTTATQSNTSAYSDAFNSAGMHEIVTTLQESTLVSRPSDSSSASSGGNKFTQGIPDEDVSYSIRVRAKNLNCLSRPIARITSIVKTGTTTATVTTDVAHNLSANSFVQIYGVLDQTNFPNLTAATQVASIVNLSQFTIVIGPAVTATSLAGAVFLNEAGVLAPGIIGQVVQSVARSNNILTVVGNANWSGLLPGETVSLYGCNTGGTSYDGVYKVLRTGTTVLELASTGSDFTTVSVGGAVIKRTDYRIHFVHQLEYTRLVTELANQNGFTDDSKVFSVTAVSRQSGTWTVGAVAPVPTSVGDINSAALTTTTTTSAITPLNSPSYQVNLIVTAVSGTTPTLDFGIEESDDSGTNWYRVYDFPRVTANGAYRTPVLPLTGNRIRYVQTVAGSGASFTRSVNRLQSHFINPRLQRQIYDRTISLTTLSSTTPSLFADGCSAAYIEIAIGAATTPPQIQLQGSNDGTNWILLGTPLTAVANSAVSATVLNSNYKFTRGIITTIGNTVTANYVLIKGFTV